MATYRQRQKKDGSISVTVTVRKGGALLTETFNERTKTKALSAAKAWAAETEAHLYLRKKNSPQVADKISLADFFAAYFDHLQLTERKRKSTVRNEVYSSTQILRILGDAMPIGEITTAMVAGYRDEPLREGVGASKIRSELALISCLFRYAIQEKGFNISNPVAPGLMWRPPAPKGKVDYLSEDEIRLLLGECRKSNNPRLAAYVSVLINTGMRPGEAATLKIKDVHVENRSIFIEKTKNDTSRRIPLTETAFREIMPLVEGRGQEEYVFYPGGILPAVILQRPAQLFRMAFDRAKVRAGLARITRHGMRHTAATHMLKNKIPLRVIAEVLGHKTLQMAMKYTHPDEDELRKAVDTLDHLISLPLE